MNSETVSSIMAEIDLGYDIHVITVGYIKDRDIVSATAALTIEQFLAETAEFGTESKYGLYQMSASLFRKTFSE